MYIDTHYDVLMTIVHAKDTNLLGLPEHALAYLAQPMPLPTGQKVKRPCWSSFPVW